VGGHFGPHNIHENRPESFISSELIFATYQNAGVRVFDIRDQYRPVEVGAMVPPTPARLVDPRPNRPRVLHSADVFVDKNGIVTVPTSTLDCTSWSTRPDRQPLSLTHFARRLVEPELRKRSHRLRRFHNAAKPQPKFRPRARRRPRARIGGKN
jgi:hypothetical protein